jgi:F-type H+-transporting ATPase subunit gamma
MASLREIRRRIKSAKNIQQITKAMKMVAAARLRKSQQRILSARPYAQKILEFIGDIPGEGLGLGHPLLQARTGGPLQVVVVGADKGLCGGFNASIIRRALLMLREGGDRPMRLVLVGRKVRDYFRRLDFGVAGEYVNFFSRLSFGDADLIAGEQIRAYLAGECSEVVLLYTHFKSTMSLQVTTQKLLPFPSEGSAAAPSTGSGQAPVRSKPEFAFEPQGQAILEALVPRAVKMQVWRALLESQASEFAARMTAMDSATRNSKEMISSLTLYANRIRQAAITREIAELVGGAAALQ